MILHTSALIAVLTYEADAELFIQALSHATQCRISAANFVELAIVLESQFPAEVTQQCDALFRTLGILIEPVTVEHSYLARQAFHDFGKGRHPAGLNFGDCFAYALAKSTGEALLFKGNDFSKTDVVPALG